MKKIILALVLATGLAAIGLSACSVPQNFAATTNAQPEVQLRADHPAFGRE